MKRHSSPCAGWLLTHPDLVRLARQMHFRPFNGHHEQVLMTDGKGNESLEAKPDLEFVGRLLAC